MFERLKTLVSAVGEWAVKNGFWISSDPHDVAKRRIFGGKMLAGAATAAANATGISAEGMSAEEAVELVNKLGQKMTAIYDTRSHIRWLDNNLKEHGRTLYGTIMDARSEAMRDLTHGIAGAEDFLTGSAAKAEDRWGQMTESCKTSYREGIRELLKTIGDSTIRVPKNILDRTVFAEIAEDEHGKVVLSRSLLEKVYAPDMHDALLNDLPAKARELWEKGSSFSAAFKRFSEQIQKTPLGQFTPQSVFSDLVTHYGNDRAIAREKLLQMSQDDRFFNQEIEAMQQTRMAQDAILAEERRVERRNDDAHYAQNFAPILAAFLGGVKWVERDDALEAYIPNDAGSERGYIAMVNLLREKGTPEDELPTFKATVTPVFQMRSNDEAVRYEDDLPVQAFKVLSLRKYHVPVLTRLIMGNGEISLHPDTVEQTLFKRASLLESLRGLGIAKEKPANDITAGLA